MTNTISKPNTVSSAEEATFAFGGPRGSAHALGDIGNQTIIFRSGKVLDSIQIGEALYGGSKGGHPQQATLPADGRIYLSTLQAGYINGDLVINYFEATINGTLIKSGEPNSNTTMLRTNTFVILSKITSGDYIDSLEFTIAS
ncbi:MAG: hypothetical protein Q8S21_02065 [Candidatus Paracaedibacteraceae bacterium]|nr:hypothetical protein [Candidatus Paracaedibacteraceae bacterium]